ncbi:MAG: HAMP domain-containing protein [Candidatus Omnitrophica bacterium]|nr:HAMP domain-containing protein [Candidatus Omnitrophota bacterium]
MADNAYKRKTYLVKRAFQLKYTGVILLFILMTVFLAGATTYYAVFPYLSEKLANVYPQNRLISILSDANLKLLYSSVIPIVLAVWIGIMLSHRIAGPWSRLETMLNDIAKGNVVKAIKLRKGDELQSLAGAINRLIDRLEIHKETTAGQMKTAQENIELLKEQASRPNPDLVAIRDAVIKLQASLDSFKSVIS